MKIQRYKPKSGAYGAFKMEPSAYGDWVRVDDLQDERSELIDIAVLMAQELQEFVDEAVEGSGSDSALLSVQALLRDWEQCRSDLSL